MSDHIEQWLLHSVHQTFGNGPPGEVFSEYERMGSDFKSCLAELADTKQQLAAAEARIEVLDATLRGTYTVLAVVLDDLNAAARAAGGGE
jgi:ribosomal protein S12 methylthiotransferase accessory factor YcaO